ncbi:iron-containing redox enzyme family protein [Gordonia sp. MP11Mi]|uniref:Iron-containing redox enzyme family protein n=1 Tax=Gordonia sp. MP11Mi TaxID=3022769 RepID=A0AA97CWS6_9ACTN
MPLPVPRGRLSQLLVEALVSDTAAPSELRAEASRRRPDILADDDAQLALTLLYELHLRGVDGVDDETGWDLDLLAVRALLEQELVDGLDSLVGTVSDPGDVVAELFAIGAEADGPPISKYMAVNGTLDEFRELMIHRSLNQLREADLHTHAIPRLHGAAKAALVEVQADEYGNGILSRMHSTLFAGLMTALGLDDGYARYINSIPAPTLAALNTLSYFGIHRSCVNELIGHLSVVETTSSLPSRDYSRALVRLGVDPSARIFFDEHVEADSVHEQLVVRRVAGELGVTEAARIGLVRGARICAAVERLASEHIWDRWQGGASSLRATAQ